MLDHRPTTTREEVAKQVRPSRRWMWMMTGSVALAVVALVIVSVVLIGGEETAVAPAFPPQLHQDSGFLEGFEPGPIIAPAPAVAPRLHANSGPLEGFELGPIPTIEMPAAPPEYRRIGGGFFEGLDGPVTGVATAAPIPESYQAVQLHEDAGFLEGLDGPVPPHAPIPTSYQTVQLHAESGFLEGLDGPLSPRASIPEDYRYLQLWGGPIEE